MPTEVEARLVRLEIILNAVLAALDKVSARQDDQEQKQRNMPDAGGSGNSSAGVFWCRSPGISAATGTWPSITPATGTADVYQDVGGTLTLVATSATIRWWYKDASVVNKLMEVVAAGDGGWDGVLDSCSVV